MSDVLGWRLIPRNGGNEVFLSRGDAAERFRRGRPELFMLATGHVIAGYGFGNVCLPGRQGDNMRVRNIVNGWFSEARLTTDHAMSSYGCPVLVLDDGTALGPGDCLGLCIVVATREEREALRAAGFALANCP